MKIDLRGVDAIIFDLGGVIINIEYQRAVNEFNELGANNFDELYSKAKQNKVFDDFEEGRMSDEAFRSAIRELINKELSDEEINRAWNAIIIDIPKQRLDLLKELKKHYQLCLLSNTNAIHVKHFEQILQHEHGTQPFVDLFEGYYYSNEIGIRKPKPAAFKYVMQQHGLVPETTLFIDDSIQHIEGAKFTGLQTHHLKDHQDILHLF